jgi:hypothetical protein
MSKPLSVKGSRRSVFRLHFPAKPKEGQFRQKVSTMPRTTLALMVFALALANPLWAQQSDAAALQRIRMLLQRDVQPVLGAEMTEGEKTGSGDAGSKARLDFQLSSPGSPITKQSQSSVLEGQISLLGPSSKIPRLGIFTFHTPETQGEMVRVSIPVGELVMRAVRGIRAKQHRRAEEKARAEVIQTLADFFKAQQSQLGH